MAVRVGSRAGEPRFDWDDRATWAPALRGARAVYVSYHPDLAAPGAAEAVGALTDLALELGVRRLVLLSGRGEEEAQRAEGIVQRSGVPWTVLRCSWFSQNFSESLMRDAVMSGEVALPVDGVPEPFVDVDDIADAAVAALTEDGHAGRLYELTGPRALRFDEACATIPEAAGRPMRFTPVSLDEFAAGAVAAGEPAEAVAT